MMPSPSLSWFNCSPIFAFSRRHLPHCLILLLLLRAGIHPHPGPQSSTISPLPSVLQLNCNGLRSSVAEINNFFQKNCVFVAALQETKLFEKSADPFFPNYTLVKADRLGGGAVGGLAFLVHHSLPFIPLTSPLSNDKVIKSQGILISLNGSNLEIYNLYIPPVLGCPRGFTPDIYQILNIPNNVLVLGDLNVHHSSWDTSLSDMHGGAFMTSIDLSPVLILNEGDVTRVPSAQNQPSSSSDVSLASAHLAIEL
jgi:hypothetical protein